jgi:hypothetical protein
VVGLARLEREPDLRVPRLPLSSRATRFLGSLAAATAVTLRGILIVTIIWIEINMNILG